MAKGLTGAALELYKRPPAGPCPVKVGDLIEKDGKTWEVLSVHRILRPFGRKDQDTYTVGYSYGLREWNDKEHR